jgi:uncharacterized protein YpuA (DUF1002 family)
MSKYSDNEIDTLINSLAQMKQHNFSVYDFTRIVDILNENLKAQNKQFENKQIISKILNTPKNEN